MTKPIEIQTSQDILGFHPQTGQLVSFYRKSVPDQNFIACSIADPVFVIQYLDKKRRFRQIKSDQAEQIRVSYSKQDRSLVSEYRRLAGMDLDVIVTVKVSDGEPFSHWSLEIHNKTDLNITDVQFPFVVVPYRLAGTPGSESLLYPFGAGVLLRDPKPQQLQPDHPQNWQMRPENGGFFHYPGTTVAQFMAYFNDRAGIYISCQDSEGRVKLIKPVHHDPHIRLGMAHVGDWADRESRKLEYDVALGSFSGDWYEAADLYRDWALKQPWAVKPLHARKDVPEWLLDSPPHIILRIQGILDAGPTNPNPEFVPYPKMIPMLENISKQVEAPLVPVVMSWERPGPWIYPDCFPPAGGDESLSEFSALARQRGWHVGSFCNGTRWVTGHFWSGYDGQDYFEEQDGASTVSRAFDGTLWKEKWDESWRPSYLGCLGVDRTRQIARSFVQKLQDMGLDWIQFLDQNCGAATFPCYAEDHEHEPLPGKWMTEKMSLLTDIFHELGKQEYERSKGKRHIAYSAEMAINEVCLQDFQICDIRVLPPGHTDPGAVGFVPLYHYLYHEFILTQGGFGSAPEPYHLQIRNAYNWVIGEIPGAVMKGDGQLLGMDTWNWAPWEPQVGNNDDALHMLRVTTALRRGAAKDFLVYGRMQHPAPVEGIKTMRWQDKGRDHQIPAVFHAAWQAPDGRFGLVMANWTNDPQVVKVSDPRLGNQSIQHLASSSHRLESKTISGAPLSIQLPPVSCVLLEPHQGS